MTESLISTLHTVFAHPVAFPIESTGQEQLPLKADYPELENESFGDVPIEIIRLLLEINREKNDVRNIIQRCQEKPVDQVKPIPHEDFGVCLLETAVRTGDILGSTLDPIQQAQKDLQTKRGMSLEDRDQLLSSNNHIDGLRQVIELIENDYVRRSIAAKIPKNHRVCKVYDSKRNKLVYSSSPITYRSVMSLFPVPGGFIGKSQPVGS